jgi:hypothetical protein
VPSNVRQTDTWLALGLAFVGGYVSGLLQLDAGVVIRSQGQVPESTNFWASH